MKKVKILLAALGVALMAMFALAPAAQAQGAHAPEDVAEDFVQWRPEQGRGRRRAETRHRRGHVLRPGRRRRASSPEADGRARRRLHVPVRGRGAARRGRRPGRGSHAFRVRRTLGQDPGRAPTLNAGLRPRTVPRGGAEKAAAALAPEASFRTAAPRPRRHAAAAAVPF